MKIVVSHNQNIWDVAVQYTGDSGNAMAILFYNNKTTTDLTPNESLIIPSELLSKKNMSFFKVPISTKWNSNGDILVDNEMNELVDNNNELIIN